MLPCPWCCALPSTSCPAWHFLATARPVFFCLKDHRSKSCLSAIPLSSKPDSQQGFGDLLHVVAVSALLLLLCCCLQTRYCRSLHCCARALCSGWYHLLNGTNSSICSRTVPKAICMQHSFKQEGCMQGWWALKLLMQDSCQQCIVCMRSHCRILLSMLWLDTLPFQQLGTQHLSPCSEQTHVHAHST